MSSLIHTTLKELLLESKLRFVIQHLIFLPTNQNDKPASLGGVMRLYTLDKLSPQSVFNFISSG